ncbi:MAG: hypothetical protein HY748_09175 [Elusimicrobia bacterium]|nr:hypothetical protein [Elusimicrobiota bacterium]
MRNAWAQVACLAALVMLSVHVKVKHSTGLPRFNPADDFGYFKVESALQYRYASMVARGEPVPEIDRDAQYPEGIRTSRELTMLMEDLTGWTWRLWPLPTHIDFRMFVILWVAVVSSLSIPALYVAALRLSADAPLAMAVTWVYGLSWASIGDFIGSYTFQCLALPLIFWSFAFFCLAIGRQVLEGEGRSPLAGGGLSMGGGPGNGVAARRGYACVSGLLMALALASWHVTRFYLGVFFAAAAWAAWRGAARDFRKAMGEALGILTAWCFLAGLALPVLRESRFALSPTMLAGYVVLAALARGPKAAAAALAAGAVLFVALGQGSVEASSYAHTYRILWDKLRFLLVKPPDPAALDPDARLLWAGPFNSPGAGFLVFNFVPLVLIALPRLGLAFRKAKAPCPRPAVLARACRFEQDWKTACPPGGWAMADALAWLCALGTAALARIAPFLAFFLCLGAARLRVPTGVGQSPTGLRLAVLVGLAALAAAEGLRSSAPYSRLNPFMLVTAPLMAEDDRPMVSLSNERQALKWLKERSGGRPVLAHFGISGPILAYSGTPVPLNPKCESASSRRKSLAFLAALYGGVEGFGRFCAEHGAAFFVYGTGYLLDETKDGARYASGSLRLAEGQAVVAFHFHPERLKGFRLVYQNPDFRIFAVDTQWRGPAAEFPQDPVYDLDRFSAKTSPDGTLSLDVAGVLSRMKVHRNELFKARLLAKMGQREAALEAYGRALSVWPSQGGAAREEIERLSGGSIKLDHQR